MTSNAPTAVDVIMDAIGSHAPDEWNADDCAEAATAVISALRDAGYIVDCLGIVHPKVAQEYGL